MPFAPALRQHFNSRELRAWAELMVERGLRIRIPFEQFFSTIVEDEEGMMILPEDEDLEDDELAFLREKEELKPY
jgi:hypothetical protein